jgi:2-amino-4-hydroxy-6-hydroxymethyldihydropteridine diphosphokinase/dihydropteroate synthase
LHRSSSSPSIHVLPKRHHSGCACHGSNNNHKKKAYLALGSNMGDRVAEIEKACSELDRRGIRVTRTSSLWETEPMYVLDQAPFLNGACEVSCLSKRQINPKWT